MKTQVKYNYINLKEKIEAVLEDIKIIKEYIINKKNIVILKLGINGK